MHKKAVPNLVRFDRLEALIEQQGKKKSHLCKLAGKGRGYISDAKSGNGSISDEALEIFARELGTTPAYLRGESDETQEKPLINGDEELTDYLDELRSRPEMRMLFSVAKGATKEDVEAAVRIIEALRRPEDVDG